MAEETATPFFSVVTPCFNAMQYLPDCLASVRHACKGLEYEHIVVDGGSADGTVEYLGRQQDIRWISEPDGGMYEALNKGIAMARGRVIGHLNTDEQYNRKGLHEALVLLEASAADAVFGPTVMVDGDGNFLQLFKQITVPKVIDTHWCMPVQSCSLLYQRSCWLREAYDTRYRLVADHVWFRHQMEQGLNLGVTKQPIGIFTWHADNLSSTEGRTSSEDALADIDRKSRSIRRAKRAYRLRKLLAGGYCRTPVDYEIFRGGQLQHEHVFRPALKLRRDLRKG